MLVQESNDDRDFQQRPKRKMLASSINDQNDDSADPNDVLATFTARTNYAFGEGEESVHDGVIDGGCNCFCWRLFRKYDTSFMISLGLQYFNTGMRGMITLALLDIFKNKYQLQPAQTSAFLSYVNLPWSPKLLYGIFTDTFPIFGSRKKSYIILCGTIQCLTNLAIAVYDWKDASSIMILAMINSGSGAVMDVVVDGLMVIMSRKDPNFGSEDLQTYSWLNYGCGGVTGCLISGVIFQYYDANLIFYVMAFFGGLIGLSGILMSLHLEQGNTDVINMGLCQRSKFVFKEVWLGLRLKELYKSVIYYTILGSVVPNYVDYLYYYQLNVAGFIEFQYSMLQGLGSATLIIGSIMFSLFFKQTEFIYLLAGASLVNCFGAATSCLFTKDITFGISPIVFVAMTSTITDTLYLGMVQLPIQILYAKLIPDQIESSMFALLTGLSNLSNLFLSKQLGNLFNVLVGVTTDSLEKLWILYVTQAFCSLVPLLFVFLIPRRSEVEKVQRCFEYLEKRKKLEAEFSTADNDQDYLAGDYDKLDPEVAIRLGICHVYMGPDESQSKLL